MNKTCLLLYPTRTRPGLLEHIRAVVEGLDYEIDEWNLRRDVGEPFVPRIRRAIESAVRVVAVLQNVDGSLNCNVTYEVGYAHALGRKTVTIVYDVNKLRESSADLASLDHLVVTDGDGFARQIEEAIRRTPMDEYQRGMEAAYRALGRLPDGLRDAQVRGSEFGDLLKQRIDCIDAAARKVIQRWSPNCDPGTRRDAERAGAVMLRAAEFLHEFAETADGCSAVNWHRYRWRTRLLQQEVRAEMVRTAAEALNGLDPRNLDAAALFSLERRLSDGRRRLDQSRIVIHALQHDPVLGAARVALVSGFLSMLFFNVLTHVMDRQQATDVASSTLTILPTIAMIPLALWSRAVREEQTRKMILLCTALVAAFIAYALLHTRPDPESWPHSVRPEANVLRIAMLTLVGVLMLAKIPMPWTLKPYPVLGTSMVGAVLIMMAIGVVDVGGYLLEFDRNPWGHSLLAQRVQEHSMIAAAAFAMTALFAQMPWKAMFPLWIAKLLRLQAPWRRE